MREDLRNPLGRLLFPKGTQLDANHLRLLRIWGVLTAEIEGVPGDFQPTSDEGPNREMIESAEKAVRKRFSLANLDHPFMQKLFRVAIGQRIRQMGQGEQTERMTPPGSEAVPPAEPPRPFLPPGAKMDPHSLVTYEVSLASLPEIYQKIQRVIHDPRSSARYIADV
ncbi:MAG: hypothetical protein NTY64_03560, partial [Deltaproteobacteria bacterium]|nr:hypothetical protein [Deltaproteobacteria bacterium]